MDGESVSGYRLLMKECDGLLGWSATLQAEHEDSADFFPAWMALAVHLLRRATVVDALNGGNRAFDLVVARCNAALLRLGRPRLPHDVYVRAVAMQAVTAPAPPRPRARRRVAPSRVGI